MTSTKVLVAQLGARKHYTEPILFHQWGVLDRFYTDFYSGNIWFTQLLRSAKLYNQLPNTLKKGLDRYDYSLKKSRILHFPKFGYQYTHALEKASPAEKSRIFLWAGKEFCQRIIQKGLGDANVVYGFNSASLELFEYAKAQGIRCILDQTLAERALAHELLLQEERTWQNWSLSPFTICDADLELMQREQREQDLADHIICGSEFVKVSLVARGISADKISVVALGRSKDVQMHQHKPDHRTPQERGDGLRILFAGAVGLRKGIPYLLEALRHLRGKIPFTCKAVGSLQIEPQRVREYSDICDFVGVVPRSQMATLYTWADVFVLPSICEGSAMVTYEALSWGLPVITTRNSGSIVRDEVDGFIVPIRDEIIITQKLIDLYKRKHFYSISTNTKQHTQQVYNYSKNVLKQVILSATIDT